MGAPAITTRPRPSRAPATARTAKAGPAPRSNRAAKAPRATASPRARRASSRPQPRAAAGAAVPRRALAGGGSVAMLPVAALGRTAGAVSGLADCGFVVAMTRSRGWIGLLAVLLGGIVALNVWGLGLSAAGSATAMRIDGLQRDNSVLRGRIATRLSNDRIEREAAALGLAVPAPDAVTYLRSGDGDARKAAKRIAAGEVSASAPLVAPGATEPVLDPATGLPVDEAALITPAPDPVAAPATDPASGLPLDPTTGLPIDPATGLPADPAAPTTVPPAG